MHSNFAFDNYKSLLLRYCWCWLSCSLANSIYDCIIQ